jgi:hypothetical protein
MKDKKYFFTTTIGKLFNNVDSHVTTPVWNTVESILLDVIADRLYDQIVIPVLDQNEEDLING